MTPFRSAKVAFAPAGCAAVVALAAAVGFAAKPEQGAEGLPARVSFNEHIRPIFASHCVGCHGGVKQASGLSFDYRERALAKADSGQRPIVAGDVEASHLIARVSDSDPDYRMPPADHGPPLTDREVALLERWIEEGAKWEEHWAFIPPERHDPPEVSQPDWCRTAMDPFILARLDREGLSPSPEATKREWLRRVSLDLVGLPPTEAELHAFLADDEEGAYERVARRLLAAPHFGERWAAMWLDLARYADTMGYEKDPHRNIWPYRDWLIRALNDDLPYDEFLIKQLAGDLLPDRTLADLVATALHRNTQTNTEGGTDDEEFRLAAVLDRVNTTWQITSGITFGCAQCHSHPYDPIEHEEYYQFLAVFNSSRDYDLLEEFPTLSVPHERDDWPRAEQLDRQISELQTTRHESIASLAAEAEQWQYLDFDRAESTGSTQVAVRTDAETGLPEVVAGGTITANSKFTLSGPIPSNAIRLTALRIDALPKNVEAARRTPEFGFILTRLYATVEYPDDTPDRELHFRAAACDEPQPLFDPHSSLKDDGEGWAGYPRIDRPRWVVLVLEEPVDLPAGSRLTLVLKQDRSDTGGGGMVMPRSRYALSGDDRWIAMVNAPDYLEVESQLAAARQARGEVAGTAIPVMAELPPTHQRHSYVFERGNWMDKGAQVTPGVPKLFPELNAEGTPNRLDVARWFTSGEHPLTSRVMVNRAWEKIFGTGLVETAEDFGSSGLKPSHPELLDDLAVRFQTDMGWSFKTLLREIVLSATYRQSARSTPELNDRDPNNRLLARGPRLRLTAEMVRDQALVLSGRFSPKMFGPPVKPPQPDGVWRTVYSGDQWTTSEGEDRYRRAVYTYWRRTSPYPSMMTFDAPARDVCTVRRIATNTPLHALVTLNDPAYVECAQGLAERMQQQGGESPRDQIAWALELATCREGSNPAIDELVALYHDALQAFDASDDEMKSLGETADAYARAIVANAILNLDDVLTR